MKRSPQPTVHVLDRRNAVQCHVPQINVVHLLAVWVRLSPSEATIEMTIEASRIKIGVNELELRSGDTASKYVD